MNKSHKVDPKACEKEMKNLTERFSHAERLNYKQIQSQFYQLKVKKAKNSDQTDDQYNAKLSKAAKILERMVNQNTFDDIAQGYFNLKLKKLNE